MYFRLRSSLTDQEVKIFRNNLINTFQTPRFISVNSSLVNISLTLVSTGVAVDVYLNNENVTTFLNSSIRQVSVVLNGEVYTASPTSYSSASTPSSNGLDSHDAFIIVGSVIGPICLIAIVAFVLLKKSRVINFQPTYQVLRIDTSFSKLLTLGLFVPDITVWFFGLCEPSFCNRFSRTFTEFIINCNLIEI